MINRVIKYNRFKPIPDLWRNSKRLAGKSYYLYPCGLLKRHLVSAANDTKSSVKSEVIEGFGGEAFRATGKNTTLCRISFPDAAANVRDFIRLTVRTKVSLAEAASVNGVSIEDLSSYQLPD